jgi:hypothetical protein
MILKGPCKKCGTEVKLDIGEMTVEGAIEKLSKQDGGFQCPGHHVEISAPVPTYWDIATWEQMEGKAPTEEEFLAKLKNEYVEVRTTDEMRGLITGFAMGFPITNDGKNWDYAHSPKGQRYYVSNG